MYTPSRRALLALISGVSLLAHRSGQAQPHPGRARSFGYEDVVERAKDLAKHPFDAESARIPTELSNLTYDSYREIRFRRDKAFLRDGFIIPRS